MKFFHWLSCTEPRRATLLCTAILLAAGMVAIFTVTKMYKMSSRLYAPLDEATTIREDFFKQDSATKALLADKLAFLKMDTMYWKNLNTITKKQAAFIMPTIIPLLLYWACLLLQLPYLFFLLPVKDGCCRALC